MPEELSEWSVLLIRVPTSIRAGSLAGASRTPERHASPLKPAFSPIAFGRLCKSIFERVELDRGFLQELCRATGP